MKKIKALEKEIKELKESIRRKDLIMSNALMHYLMGHNIRPSMIQMDDEIKKSLCIPRKDHRCRLCGKIIQKGEPCKRWSWVERGEGWWTSHAHHECYQQTYKDKWDEGDWENCGPGDAFSVRPTQEEIFTL